MYMRKGERERGREREIYIYRERERGRERGREREIYIYIYIYNRERERGREREGERDREREGEREREVCGYADAWSIILRTPLYYTCTSIYHTMLCNWGEPERSPTLLSSMHSVVYYYIYIYHQAIAHASNVSRITWRRCPVHYVYAIAKKKKAQKSMLRHSYRYQRV